MGTYISKRILLFIPTLIMVTLLVFVIVRLIPGDPALMLLFGDGDGQFTQEELDNLRKKLGTDKPIYEQYGLWVWNMLHLDFGKSYRSEAPIAGDLKDKFAVTFELTILAVLMAVVVAVPLGVISAIKQDTLIDYVARIITLAGIALPTFWVGILTVYLLVRLFHWLPPLEYVQIWEDPAKNLQQLIFPAITLGALLMAFIAPGTKTTSRKGYPTLMA
jgi:peptide/nickel transport system permease protein